MLRDAVPSDAVRLVASDPGEFAMYAWRNVDLIIWDQPPRATSVRRMSRALFQRVREAGTRCSGIHLVPEQSGPPDSSARAEFMNVGRTHQNGIACIGVVVERQGFLAGTIRAAVTGILLVSAKYYTTRMFDSLEDAAKWLPAPHTKLTGVNIDEAALLRFFSTARGEHTAHNHQREMIP